MTTGHPGHQGSAHSSEAARAGHGALMQTLTHLIATLFASYLILMIPFRLLGVSPPRLAMGSWLRSFPRVVWFLLWTTPVAVVRALVGLWGDRAREAHCAKGCGKRIPTRGLVRCTGCGYTSQRSVFAPCPICGRARCHFRCPHCGRSISRPGLGGLEQPPRRYLK